MEPKIGCILYLPAEVTFQTVSKWVFLKFEMVKILKWRSCIGVPYRLTTVIYANTLFTIPLHKLTNTIYSITIL